MKKNLTLEYIIRKALLNETVHTLKVRAGSDKAVAAATAVGVPKIINGNSQLRTVFTVMGKTTEKHEEIPPLTIARAIAISPQYGEGSSFEQASVIGNPYKSKYAYVYGHNVSKRPYVAKYYVWVIDLDLIYSVSNQIDKLLPGSADDIVTAELESFGPSEEISNIPLYELSSYTRMSIVIRKYINQFKDKIKIPNDQIVVPELSKLIKDYDVYTSYGSSGEHPVDSNIDLIKQIDSNGTPIYFDVKNFENEDDMYDLVPFYKFSGKGLQYVKTNGSRTFMPTEGKMSIFKYVNSTDTTTEGVFEGSFKNGWPAVGTLTFPDWEKPLNVNNNMKINQDIDVEYVPWKDYRDKKISFTIYTKR